MEDRYTYTEGSSDIYSLQSRARNTVSRGEDSGVNTMSFIY